MVAADRLIADVLHDQSPEGPGAGNRSAFVSETDRFADYRGGSFYTGNASESTTRPFLQPHKENLRQNMAPTTYWPKWKKLRPRSTSPNFTKLVPRGDCFDTPDKSVEFLFRENNYDIETEAQEWARRPGAKFSKSPQRPKAKPKPKSCSVYNPDRGSQGGGRYQSMASAAQAGRSGSPQKYSAAFRGTGRDSSFRKKETGKARRERKCREKLGPGRYSAPHAALLHGSVRRAQTAAARFSPSFVPSGRAAHDTAPTSNHINPGPGQYDGAGTWNRVVALRVARGEVRLDKASSGAGLDFRSAPAVGAGIPARTKDTSMKVPAVGEGTWSLQKDERSWRRSGRSVGPVGSFSGQQRLTLPQSLSYRTAIK